MIGFNLIIGLIFGHFHRSDWTLSIEIDPIHQKINIPLIQIHMLNLPSILQDFCWRCLWLGLSPIFVPIYLSNFKVGLHVHNSRNFACPFMGSFHPPQQMPMKFGKGQNWRGMVP